MNGDFRLRRVAFGTIAIGIITTAIAVLKFVFHWTFVDALVVPCFVLTGSVMIVQYCTWMYSENTTRENVRGRWLYGVCAFICVALGALQPEPVGLLFFGQLALINLCAFVKPPQLQTMANAQNR